MIEVRQTDTFKEWLQGLHDRSGAAIIARRLARVANGNLGDVKAIDLGIYELRVHVGPGYRVYLWREQSSGPYVVLLCGGDKGSQKRDIARARKMATELDQ